MDDTLMHIQIEIVVAIMLTAFGACGWFCMYLLNRIAKLEDAVNEQKVAQSKLSEVLQNISQSQEHLAEQLHRFADRVSTITNVLTRLETIIERER